jgi:glycine/D-amino acid oxidase-like deaminating enzyme/nitrite reductase/ring-hydroxylating ferredoxin subunit
VAASVAEAHVSHWVASAPGPEHPALDRDLDCDVAVLGAGIVGVSAAHRLASKGAAVVLLEARRVGSGATGYTTAKLSSLHGLSYARLQRKHGEDVARAYGAANQAGLEQIAELAQQLGIECDLRRKPNFTYTELEGNSSELMQEASAAKGLGLPASFVADSEGGELPFELAAAVRFSDQAEFHPLRYLNGLAAAAADAGCELHEGTRVTALDQGDPSALTTDAGQTVRAGHVIVATHLPVFDRGLYFARSHPERSYVLLARLRGAVPQGMYLSDESTAHSLRSVPSDDGELLMVGGESHKVGQADEAERYAELERWARERFEVEELVTSWSTQDHIPADQLPYVGRLWPFSGRVLTATGFRKWGLAMGAFSGRVLADRVLDGEEEDGAQPFSPVRLHPLAGGPSFVKENANVGWHFFSDRLRRGSAETLVPGKGAVVGSGLGQRAVYRDEAGELHSLSARCTHLGCIVAFNEAERTWDCPCHGSRFGIDGEVLEGPAVHPLEPRD